MSRNGITYYSFSPSHFGSVAIPVNQLLVEEAAILHCLRQIDQPCWLLNANGQVGAYLPKPVTSPATSSLELLAIVPSLSPQQLGDPTFLQTHGVRYAYYTGAMANGIASEKLVIAMGQAGLLGSFGAAGLLPSRLEEAIQRIQQALPTHPYAFNLIHSPSEDALERQAVELYLHYGIRCIEASAFLELTPHLVRYRVSGLEVTPENQLAIHNRVIAKVSRREVATKFMSPAPQKILHQLVKQRHITEQQAQCAALVPMADDITVEADSGGHTDNRSLLALLPTILSLRNELQTHYQYAVPIRVGAGGGIGSPTAALAAFSMGASYIVTGSINQACVEAHASEQTKQLLAQAEITDMTMAPAADMFEMGVKLQVLKRGTMFPMRAQKLYELYYTYNGIEDLPLAEKRKLEQTNFSSTPRDSLGTN